MRFYDNEGSEVVEEKYWNVLDTFQYGVKVEKCMDIVNISNNFINQYNEILKYKDELLEYILLFF